MAKRGGFPGGMPGNMNNLMKQAQRMQRQMEEQQAELENKEFSATAGGGVVEVTVTGKREVSKVKIDPEAVDPDDVEMLEDLIVAATNEALRKCEEESQAQMMRLHKVPMRRRRVLILLMDFLNTLRILIMPQSRQVILSKKSIALLII